MGRSPPPGGGKHLLIPCAECEGCRKAKALGWALRCHLELTQHEGAAFWTGTYDEKHVPPTLSRQHYAAFIKRLRARLAGRKPARTIRHFGCGEYGEENGRPHCHSIIFGADARDEDLLRECWNKGTIDVENATPATINYVAGYVQKKYGDVYSQHKRGEQVDQWGEVYTYQPPFIQMSRRPGIGGHARQWPSSWKEYAIYDGIKIPVPRFLHDAWKTQATQEEIEQLAADKLARAESKPLPDLEAQAAINNSRREIAAAKRKL